MAAAESFPTTNYDPKQAAELVYAVEHRWYMAWQRAWAALVRQVLANPTGPVPSFDDYLQASADSMAELFLLGVWSGGEEGIQRRHDRGLEPLPSPFTRKLWDEPKFPTAFDAVYGVPKESLVAYQNSRMPPIVDATKKTQGQVRDAVKESVQQGFDHEELKARLTQVGNWPDARVRNQLRTESSTLFNAGRSESFIQDPQVVGYMYDVVEDDRTTELCTSWAGKRVRATQVPWVPPGHYQCRTILIPLYPWDAPEFTSHGKFPDGPGEQGFPGFGQQDLANRMRLAGKKAATTAQGNRDS